MNRTETTAAALITCPKCDGSGHIRAFAHIANGDCFACGASGLVDARAVSDNGRFAGMASKTIGTPFGDLTIMRFGDGFQAYHADGCVWFSMTDSTVHSVEMSSSLLRLVTPAAARSALQAACTA